VTKYLSFSITKTLTSSAISEVLLFCSSTASASAATMAIAGAPRVRMSLIACQPSSEPRTSSYSSWCGSFSWFKI